VVRVNEDTGHPFGAGRSLRGLPGGDRLLHLDWHPLNLLVDEARGEICGVVDWDNARAGDPVLDLARTRAILTVEPSLDSLPRGLRGGLEALLTGWADGYGVRDIPPLADAWAGRVMLADVAARHAENEGALDRLRAWTERAERAAAGA
jgi:aminoglycoside phosphotransferase (APT) family kinase protein